MKPQICRKIPFEISPTLVALSCLVSLISNVPSSNHQKLLNDTISALAMIIYGTNFNGGQYHLFEENWSIEWALHRLPSQSYIIFREWCEKAWPSQKITTSHSLNQLIPHLKWIAFQLERSKQLAYWKHLVNCKSFSFQTISIFVDHADMKSFCNNWSTPCIIVAFCIIIFSSFRAA